MLDENSLREHVLRAAAQRLPAGQLQDKVTDVLSGRRSLRQLADTGIVEHFHQQFQTAVKRYQEHGQDDVRTVRRAFDPDAQDTEETDGDA